jgi:membrane protease YdiL (CAAX protease family)
MNRRFLIERVIPLLIFFALWLIDRLAPLFLLPLFFLPFVYVIFIEKKAISNLGFRKGGLQYSIYLGSSFSVLLMAVYYFVFIIHYFDIEHEIPSIYGVFTNVIWLPLYEEVAFRGFFLSHFSDSSFSAWTKRNFTVNLFQSVLYLSVYTYYLVTHAYFMLVPMFFLSFLNGIIFLMTRNIYGCLLTHSALNAFILLLSLV